MRLTLEFCCLGSIHRLEKDSPAWEVTTLNGIPQICDTKIRVFTTQSCCFRLSVVLDALIRDEGDPCGDLVILEGSLRMTCTYLI